MYDGKHPKTTLANSDQTTVECQLKLTSGGVATFGSGRSTVGFEVAGRGDLSIESRDLCKGECESDSDLAVPLFSLLTLGVAGDVLLGVSGVEDLIKKKKQRKMY